MAITPLPFLDRTLPTFKADTDKFFGQQLPQFSVDINSLATSVDSANTAATASKNAAAGSATAAATSATNAANSATAANTSKNAAATSATNAGTSESNALSSKNAAAGSATAAATSATNAGTSETNALASKNAAASSATAAGTSATNAANSASAASTSATNAATSKTNADTAASNASTSATNAANSATAANSSKTAAATSATNAANSEANALSYRNSASTSAGNAANSAAAAEAAATAATAGGVKTVNGKSPNSSGAVVLVAGDLGLGSVNNTADSAKPVSTAQAAAIAQKLSLTGGTLTGELLSSATNAFRIITGNYGTFWRQDAAALYLMVTAINDQTGSFTTARPLTVNLATGVASINGNAATANALTTARKIGGTAFNGTADIGVNAQWIGDTTESAMPTGTATYSAADANLLVDGLYNAASKGFPIGYGNRLQIRGHGLSVTEMYMEWANGAGSRIFVRSRGDVNTHSWSAMREVAFVDSNVASATKLATARTISVSGDATGSASFDGSGNISIPIVVADDSHNHVMSNVDGLVAALAAKAASGDNNDIITIRAQRYVDKLVTNTAATGTVTLNCLLASVFELTLTGNTTLAFSNLPPMSGETYSVLVTVKQGATARILTMPASTTYITSGNAAIPTPAANKQQDYIFTTKNAGSSWEVRAGAAT